LYRDTDNKIIAGVCSGIGHYLNLNAAWIRIIFIVFAAISVNSNGLHSGFSRHFIFGIPFMLFVYIVLWIVVPRTKTPRQNLEMHGYASTQHNANINSHTRKNDFGSFIINIFRIFIQIFAGISMLTIGIVCCCLFIAGIAVFFGGSLFGGKNLVSLLDYVYIGEVNTWLVKSVIAVLIFIPVGVLIYFMIKILMRLKVKDKSPIIFLFIVWLIAAMFAFGCAVTVVEHYRYKRTSEISSEINFSQTKTLNVKIPDKFVPLKVAFTEWDYSPLYTMQASNSLFVCPSVHIVRVDSISDSHIKIVKSARASTRYKAKRKSQTIPNGYTVSDSTTITLQPMEFDKNSKWSSEWIDIYIYLPVSIDVNVY
jgi:phage shock protein PspC (stress-responsive transcriptional regulator)